MNPQRQIHTLRLQLLAMSRLSQRALDYSVKGYEFRNLDFARQVGTSNDNLEEHYRRIKELSGESVNGGIVNASDFRFAFAALSIAAALHATHSVAAEIAQRTIHLLESSGIEKCASMEKLAEGVNASMRLCVIALFERDARHARAALLSQEQSVQLFELDVCYSSASGPQEEFERRVIRGLGEVAKQAREMAAALIFWLEGNRMSPPVSMTDVRYLSHHVVSVRQQGDAPMYIQSKEGLRPQPLQGFSC